MGSARPLALFLPRMDDGGAERVMLQLGASFAARGLTVDLVVATSGGPLDDQVPSQVRRVDLAAKRTVMALPALVGYLRRARPLAILSTLEHSNVLSVWATSIARAGVRVVLREANVLTPREEMRLNDHVLRALMRRFYPAASSIVAVSAGVARSLESGLGLSPARIRTIYNPVITPSLAEKASQPLEDPFFAPGAPPVILGVGRLVAQKDFPTLLRAFARVRARRAARLFILGEGEDRAALEKLAAELGIAPDVRMPGYHHNPFRYMSRSTVFALSSTHEGLPGALIQAMACGCRVISTDCPGGSREILADGALGPLVPMRDPEALARGLDALLDAAEKSPARPRYDLERFSESATVGAYLQELGAA